MNSMKDHTRKIAEMITIVAHGCDDGVIDMMADLYDTVSYEQFDTMLKWMMFAGVTGNNLDALFKRCGCSSNRTISSLTDMINGTVTNMIDQNQMLYAITINKHSTNGSVHISKTNFSETLCGENMGGEWQMSSKPPTCVSCLRMARRTTAEDDKV